MSENVNSVFSLFYLIKRRLRRVLLIMQNLMHTESRIEMKHMD